MNTAECMNMNASSEINCWNYYILNLLGLLLLFQKSLEHYHIVKMTAPQIPPIPSRTSATDTPIPKPELGAFPFLRVAIEEAILDAKDNCDDRAALASAKGEGKMPLDEDGVEVPKNGGGASVFPKPLIVAGGLSLASLCQEGLQRDGRGTNNSTLETGVIAS